MSRMHQFSFFVVFFSIITAAHSANPQPSRTPFPAYVRIDIGIVKKALSEATADASLGAREDAVLTVLSNLASQNFFGMTSIEQKTSVLQNAQNRSSHRLYGIILDAERASGWRSVRMFQNGPNQSAEVRDSVQASAKFKSEIKMFLKNVKACAPSGFYQSKSSFESKRTADGRPCLDWIYESWLPQNFNANRNNPDWGIDRRLLARRGKPAKPNQNVNFFKEETYVKELFILKELVMIEELRRRSNLEDVEFATTSFLNIPILNSAVKWIGAKVLQGVKSAFQGVLNKVAEKVVKNGSRSVTPQRTANVIVNPVANATRLFADAIITKREVVGNDVYLHIWSGVVKNAQGRPMKVVIPLKSAAKFGNSMSIEAIEDFFVEMARVLDRKAAHPWLGKHYRFRDYARVLGNTKMVDPIYAHWLKKNLGTDIYGFTVEKLEQMVSGVFGGSCGRKPGTMVDGATSRNSFRFVINNGDRKLLPVSKAYIMSHESTHLHNGGQGLTDVLGLALNEGATEVITKLTESGTTGGIYQFYYQFVEELIQAVARRKGLSLDEAREFVLDKNYLMKNGTVENLEAVFRQTFGRENWSKITAFFENPFVRALDPSMNNRHQIKDYSGAQIRDTMLLKAIEIVRSL